MELLFLLLPVAAISGWLIGRHRNRPHIHNGDDCLPLSKDYFKGLNYLLNEQSDKALEVFIQMSELDSDTVELHFALASLFVKRGEVDRAIHIHQNLIARPMLSRQDRHRALFELGQDYMRAGLLDRAESLFSELIDDSKYGQRSRRQLLEVYQQEKEWDKAIQIARRLDSMAGQPLSPILAHFYCEQADAALASGDSSLAMKMVKRAFSEDKNSVRATLIESKLHLLNQNPKAAIKSLKRVEKQKLEYLPLILDMLHQAYEKLGNTEAFIQYLQQLPDGSGHTPTLYISDQLHKVDSEEKSRSLLTQSLSQRPSLKVLMRLMELRAQKHSDDDELQLAVATLNKFLQDKPAFHCENCGFSSKSMHWQCPSCKQWDRIKPIHGIEGD